MQDRHRRQVGPDDATRKQNTNTQGDINQSGWGNGNGQQIGKTRRLNSNIQSSVQQTGFGNSNVQEEVGQNQGFNNDEAYTQPRDNSNAQSGIEETEWGNANAQEFVGQKDLNKWQPTV